MSVLFDPSSGRLRLDQPAFDRLLTWVDGQRDIDTHSAPLLDAGVIVEGEPHPTIAPALRAVTGSLCRLRLNLTDDQGTFKAGDGWVAPGEAALLLDVGDGHRDLLTLHPTLLPAAIARVTRMDPIPPTKGEPLQITADLFWSLLSTNASDRAAAAGLLASQDSTVPLGDLIDELVNGPWRCWTVTAEWRTPQGEPASRVLRVLSTKVGMCLCDVSDDTTTVWPVNTTRVWRQLTLLLPNEVEGAEQTQ